MKHLPPPGVPAHLLEPSERMALRDFGGNDNEWARACHEAALRAIQDPDRWFRPEFGLSMRAFRRPVNRGEHRLGNEDRLGREVLLELAKRQRGE